MNWLAHVFLSEPDVEFRLGNLLADLVKGPDRKGMSDAFLRGVRRHQAIDQFTDVNPLVGQSRARVRGTQGEYGRFAGILVDVFYDHFLARNWVHYCCEPLDAFTARLYASIREHPIELPPQARTAVSRMLAEDTLGSYRRIEGIGRALRRVSMRLSARCGRTFQLQQAVPELVRNFDGLARDFEGFFPALRTHVEQNNGAEPPLQPSGGIQS